MVRHNEYAKIKKKEALIATYKVLKEPDIPDVWKKDFLKNFTIQQWSENYQTKPSSKIIGNRYMSEGAYKLYLKNMNKTNLHHEHVTTKNLIYNLHFKNHFLDTELDEIEYWMDSCAFACIITNDENTTYLGKKLKQNMPDEFWDINHPWYMRKWARYLKVDFTNIWIVEWDEDKIPHKIARPDFTETI